MSRSSAVTLLVALFALPLVAGCGDKPGKEDCERSVRHVIDLEANEAGAGGLSPAQKAELEQRKKQVIQDTVASPIEEHYSNLFHRTHGRITANSMARGEEFQQHFTAPGTLNGQNVLTVIANGAMDFRAAGSRDPATCFVRYLPSTIPGTSPAITSTLTGC